MCRGSSQLEGRSRQSVVSLLPFGGPPQIPFFRFKFEQRATRPIKAGSHPRKKISSAQCVLVEKHSRSRVVSLSTVMQ